jgi:dolichyl-phosphate beta-glucosyltransferase
VAIPALEAKRLRAVPVPRPPAAAETDVVDLTVVMPAFNEQRRIGPSIEAVCSYLRQSGWTWELIVVDDGSSDLTASIADAILCTEPCVQLIRSPRNSGKGHAVRIGVLVSRGREVLISDADLSTPIGEIEQLRTFGADAVVAIGSRAHSRSRIEVRQSLLRVALGRAGNWLIRAVAVSGIADTQCGFKLLNGEAARMLFALTRVKGWGIDVEILHLCARFGWPVAEVPVRWRHSTGSRLRPTAYLNVLAEIAVVRLVHRRTARPDVEIEHIREPHPE